MQKLLDGIVHFRRYDFETHRELFSSLKEGQKPHTLFISCSDSRVDPNLITKTLPGELFIVRNIANLVPPYRDTAEFVATTSAIEYAVLALDVENMIVCGHSNCGGCASALKAPEAREWMMEQANVVEQLGHLWTYSYIRDRVMDGTLSLSGWYYIIETGAVFIYDREQGAFSLAN